jgi:hypothetical protein
MLLCTVLSSDHLQLYNLNCAVVDNARYSTMQLMLCEVIADCIKAVARTALALNIITSALLALRAHI